MFKSNRSLLHIAFSYLTAYMGRSGLILYAGEFDPNAPEVKDAIKAAIEEATKSLADKNKELLQELKDARKGKSISPEDLEKIESERDSYKEQAEKLAKDLKTANVTAEKATKALEAESGFTQKLLIDNGLLETLGKNGVTNPVHQKAAVAMLRSGVQIVVDGENRIAKVGDKPLADYVKEWAGSEEGKHFVAAPANSGGGAQGGDNKGGGKTMTRTQFDAASHADRAAFAKEGGKVVD